MFVVSVITREPLDRLPSGLLQQDRKDLRIHKIIITSSNYCPMWMQISIYESYWWNKYLGKTDKSPINNAELQRIVLGTLDMFVVIFVRCGCRFRYMNRIGGISIWERQKNHQSTLPSCKGSFLVH